MGPPAYEGDPAWRELVDALETAGTGLHAQAAGHHAVVEMQRGVRTDLVALTVGVGAHQAAVEGYRTAVLEATVLQTTSLAELKVRVAALEIEAKRENDIEEKSESFHREIVEKTGIVIVNVARDSARTVGEILRSKPLVGIYGFLSYAVIWKLAAWLHVGVPTVSFLPAVREPDPTVQAEPGGSNGQRQQEQTDDKAHVAPSSAEADAAAGGPDNGGEGKGIRDDHGGSPPVQ